MKDGIARATACGGGNGFPRPYVPKEMVERLSKDPLVYPGQPRSLDQVNHKDPKIDALSDSSTQPRRRRSSAASAKRCRARRRRHGAVDVTTLPFIQAAQDYVKGYVYERGLEDPLSNAWLDNSSGDCGACEAEAAARRVGGVGGHRGYALHCRGGG